MDYELRLVANDARCGKARAARLAELGEMRKATHCRMNVLA